MAADIAEETGEFGALHRRALEYTGEIGLSHGADIVRTERHDFRPRAEIVENCERTRRAALGTDIAADVAAVDARRERQRVRELAAVLYGEIGEAA